MIGYPFIAEPLCSFLVQDLTDSALSGQTRVDMCQDLNVGGANASGGAQNQLKLAVLRLSGHGDNLQVPVPENQE